MIFPKFWKSFSAKTGRDGIACLSSERHNSNAIANKFTNVTENIDKYNRPEMHVSSKFISLDVQLFLNLGENSEIRRVRCKIIIPFGPPHLVIGSLLQRRLINSRSIRRCLGLSFTQLSVGDRRWVRRYPLPWLDVQWGRQHCCPADCIAGCAMA